MIRVDVEHHNYSSYLGIFCTAVTLLMLVLENAKTDCQQLLEHRVNLLHLIEVDADQIPCPGLGLPLLVPLHQAKQNNKLCPGLVLGQHGWVLQDIHV